MRDVVVVLAEAQGSHANVRAERVRFASPFAYHVELRHDRPSEVLEFAVAHGAAGDEISAGGGHRERRHGRDVRHHLRVALAIHGAPAPNRRPANR